MRRPRAAAVAPLLLALGAAAVMTSAAGQERFASALVSGVRRWRR